MRGGLLIASERDFDPRDVVRWCECSIMLLWMLYVVSPARALEQEVSGCAGFATVEVWPERLCLTLPSVAKSEKISWVDESAVQDLSNPAAADADARS